MSNARARHPETQAASAAFLSGFDAFLDLRQRGKAVLHTVPAFAARQRLALGSIKVDESRL